MSAEMRCRRARDDEHIVLETGRRATLVVERQGAIAGAGAVSFGADEGRLELGEAALRDVEVGTSLLARACADARALHAQGVSVAVPHAHRALCRAAQMLGYFPRSRAGDAIEHRKQIAALADGEHAFRHFDEVPWRRWPGENPATLLFVVSGGRILLIEKKRGHGAGMVNGPGGKVEAAETPVRCAVREVEEETGVHPLGARLVGELHFQYTNGDSVFGYAFRADAYTGALIETAEAKPFWVSVHRIPYADMWDDDRVWLPLLIEDRPFVGRFLVHRERLFQHRIVPRDRAHPQPGFNF